MTIDDIANFCEFRDCRVSVGHPEHGFIHIDGTGIVDRSYTYNRIGMFGEAAGLASPARALEHADTFKVVRGSEARTLNRAEFEQELSEFQKKAGIL